MKILNQLFFITLAILVSLNLYACFEYNTNIQLTGKIEARNYPGAPNYKDTTNGDASDLGFYLVLTEKICVNGQEANASEEIINRAKSDITVVQLVLENYQIETVRNNVGKVVNLKGVLVDAHTVHHHVPLLLKVSGS